jgi:hypothetical protein
MCDVPRHRALSIVYTAGPIRWNIMYIYFALTKGGKIKRNKKYVYERL